MIRNAWILIGIALTGLALGCSDSKSPTGGTQAGDLNDPNFLAVKDFIDDAGTLENWQRAVDLSFGFLDWQFFSAGSARRSLAAAVPANEDILIDSAYYNYSGGWHIWHGWATIYDYDRAQTLEAEAWDSLQIVVSGEPQQGGFDTLSLVDADIIRVRAHYEYQVLETTCQGSGHHRIDVTVEPFGALGAIVLNATARDTLNAGIGCVSDYCTAQVATSGNFLNVRFEMIEGENGVEPSDCPNAGSATIAANIAVACEGSDPGGLDTLTVSGGWAINLNVQAEDDIRISFTRGDTTWSFVDTCNAVTLRR